MEMLCGGLVQISQDSWTYSSADSPNSSISHYDPQRLASQSFYPQPLCPSPEPASPAAGMQLPVQLPAGQNSSVPGGCPQQLALQMWEQCRRSQMLSARGFHSHHHLVHHPHHLPHLSHHPHPNTIARRNERERNRVKTINSTFSKLRQHLPCSSKSKKLSKVQILRSAIQYINQLAGILEAQDQESRSESSPPSPPTDGLSCKVEPVEAADCEGGHQDEHQILHAESIDCMSASSSSPRIGLSGQLDDVEDEDDEDEDDDLENLADMEWLQ